ncbi:MAG: hypothetical protein ACYCWN_12090, partial [Ferrimicrobium sp.]
GSVQYVLVTLVAAMATYLVVPVVRRIAFRTNQVVPPGHPKRAPDANANRRVRTRNHESRPTSGSLDG